MQQKIKRITQCGNPQCGKPFSYTYDLGTVSAGLTSYSLSCPFCHIRQAVPLHSVRKVVVLKDGTQQESTGLSLPENPVGKVEE